MDSKIVLLRGINLGASNRVAMPALRQALSSAGHRNVRTYVQSGNIVLDSDAGGAALERSVADLIESEFGLAVPVIVLDTAELRAVLDANPFTEIAERDPKRFQVTFLSQTPEAAGVAELERFAAEVGEPFAARGRALYAWHPDGVHVSKLASRMTPKRLGVESATARNWATVKAVLELAGDGD